MKDKLKEDLSMLGLPTDFTLDIKRYSKIYNGRYDPNTKTVIVYAYREDGTVINYNRLLETVIHEAIHHYQWAHDNSFKRVKGVMHNPKFKALEEKYLNKAFNKGEKI